MCRLSDMSSPYWFAECHSSDRRPRRNSSLARARLVGVRAVVLVEGISDQVALETLAGCRGRNLETEGVSVVPIGGAQAIGRFLNRFGPQGSDVRLAGLC